MKKIIYLFFFILIQIQVSFCQPVSFKQTSALLSKVILKNANEALLLKPITVTQQHSERSAGGLHDFFSEGDYWWPDSSNPSGPYIQKDGLTNPNNFTAHRLAMIRFSKLAGVCTSAFLLTKDKKYSQQVVKHLKAWFIDTATLMNPSLLYAQAIKGRFTGRGVGIIDMIQMLEVAQSVRVLEKYHEITPADLKMIKNWFSNYLTWVNTHQYGIDEREAKNNHGTCWTMQVAVFAKLVNDTTLLNFCKNRFKTVLLPNQLDKNGSFPLELKRTKPFGYSIFNLDAMVTLAHVLSDEHDNLFATETPNHTTLQNAINFLYPYVNDKNTWPYNKDVMYWNEWPVAQPFLLFGAKAYQQQSWYTLWKKLDHFPKTEEVIRNLPIRNPLIWLDNK